MKKIFFLDCDGVVTNLTLATINLLKDHKYFKDNYENNKETLFDGTKEWESFVWTEIEKAGFEFWRDLPKYDYSDKLINELEKLGEVVFLTSLGNINKYTLRCSNASKGKVLWINNHYPLRKLIITKEKYLCASDNRILIDDLEKNIKDFEEYGGKAFQWDAQKDFDEQILKIKEIK